HQNPAFGLDDRRCEARAKRKRSTRGGRRQLLEHLNGILHGRPPLGRRRTASKSQLEAAQQSLLLFLHLAPQRRVGHPHHPVPLLHHEPALHWASSTSDNALPASNSNSSTP
ncbi:unnamed protein product, partial [Musa acuminata subsp. burmannicoides]